MKKALYLILLAVEFFVSFIILAMAAGWIGWIFFGVVTIVWAALMGAGVLVTIPWKRKRI